MSGPTRKKHRSRLTRDDKAYPQFELTERHQQILLLVHEHRFLSTELLWHLLCVEKSETSALGQDGLDGKRRPRRYGFGQQALYKALQKLFHGGYLERHFLYDQPIGRGRGSQPSIYGLGAKSARVLPDWSGCTAREVQEIVQGNKVKAPFLRHALEVARFRVTLELACRGSSGRVKLLFWEQGLQLRDQVYTRDMIGEEMRLSVYPDALFAIQVLDKGRAFYLLEIDRGTMPIRATGDRSDLVKKFVAYRAYRSQGRQAKRYAYLTRPTGEPVGLLIKSEPDRDTDSSSTIIPVPGFNVLFVMPGSIDSEGVTGGRIRNSIVELTKMGKAFSTSSLFWFCHRSD